MTAASLFSLTGKTALVTGASYGLGVTFAETLAGAGANLVLAARSLDKLEAVAAKLTAAGHNAFAVKCDVGDPDAVAAMVAAGWQRFGRIDVLVNNAGVAAEAAITPERTPHKLFEKTVRVNLLGTWYCCREVGARQLADGKGGSIINIASIAGLAGVADFPSGYQSSKAAVINLTRNLAASWADRGIRVNAIAPGWFKSELTGPVFGIPEYLRWVSEAAPLGRVADAAELKGPLLLLASAAGSFVTGHTLVVDGGLSATGAGGRMPKKISDLFAASLPDGLGTHIEADEQTRAGK
jgi:NAD(P)-dependent dehydrogenase (short-subunit alcohol dehydrogenase family)